MLDIVFMGEKAQGGEAEKGEGRMIHKNFIFHYSFPK